MISDMGKRLKPRCTTGGRGTTATQAFQFGYELTIDNEKLRTWMTSSDFVAITGVVGVMGNCVESRMRAKGHDTEAEREHPLL
jgi:hypothetical protein